MKLPVIVAQGEVSGAFPQPHASLDVAGAPGRALAQAGDVLTAEGIRTSQVYADARSKLRAADAKNEAEAAADELDERFAEEDIRLKRDMTDPDEYVPKLQEFLTTTGSELATSMKYPEAQQAFLGALRKFATRKMTKARYDAEDMRHARVSAMDPILQAENARLSVAAETPEEQKRNFKRGLERPKERLEAGIYTAEKHGAVVKKFLSDVATARVSQEARDPEREEEVIDRLARGEVQWIEHDDQLRLAQQFREKREARIREDVRREEKLERAEAKRADEERKRQVDDLDELADAGELTAERLRQAKKDRVAVDDDYRRLSAKVRETGQAGGRTVDTIYNQLELDILSKRRRVSREEVRRIQSSGNLAATGPRSAATLLKMIKDDEDATTRGDKDISQSQLFKQGKNELQVLRGGAGPLESITGEQRERLENAEREFYDIARSGRVAEDQLPEAARKIVDRLRKQVPLTGDPATTAQLRYQKPEDLLAAQKAGLIPPHEFNKQFKLMQQLGLIKVPTQTGEPSGGR